MPTRQHLYITIFILLAFVFAADTTMYAGQLYYPKIGDSYILTPKAPARPQINGPKVFGVRPGSPLLFTIRTTGDRPMTFSAENLPAGCVLNGATGRITGKIDKQGTYTVKLTAANALGRISRELRIVVGDTIALTPPMGWNSWNCWAASVTAEKVLQTAHGMVDSGLINHGWTYINIDEGWQGKRGGPFKGIQGNEIFPDMQKLCNEIHSLGLKFGVYSTPWTNSYGSRIGGTSDHEDGSWDPNTDTKGERHFGKYSFLANDARQWAAWGLDYVKYDWKPNDIPHVEEIAKSLREYGRDIIFSMSNAAPFKDVETFARYATCWRTTGDITDVWDSHPKTERKAQGIMNFMNGHERWRPYQRPGHYNDPDMLVVGNVGWGEKLHPTRLTPDEQYTHISLWCLWSAPLLLGCPLDKLDAFTIGLLTNDEVLAVNQDPLCIQAALVSKEGELEVWAKNLEDGSKAVGLLNRDAVMTNPVTVRWSDLSIGGPQRVRDLWRQQDIGQYESEFIAAVRPHGVVLIRISPAD